MSGHFASSIMIESAVAGGTGVGDMEVLLDNSDFKEKDLGINDLICNLDHDIPEIRVRALQCLQRKIDNGLLQTCVLSKRVDLLNRLSCWLRSDSWTEEELVLIAQFLSQMCQHEDFRKNFVSTPLEDLLHKAKLVVRENTKALVDNLLDSARSFKVQYEGLAETCNENLSCRLPLCSVNSPDMSYEREFSPHPRNNLQIIKSRSGESSLDKEEPIDEFKVFFKTDIPKIIPESGIATIRLDVSDRRVLASAVESLLSKNEGLVFMTTCFVRDVLLDDFPAETFVQECSVSQGLVTVIQEPWEDSKLNYAGFQALYKLSNLLKMRFATLDFSEFYSPQDFSSQRQRSSTLTTTSRTSQHFVSRTSTDYFLSNLCQLIKTILFAIRKVKNIYLWVLMDSFCYTLHICVQTFNYDSILLSTQLEEILLDLCQLIKSKSDEYTNLHDDYVTRRVYDIHSSSHMSEGYLKNQDNPPPIPIAALIFSSLLNSLEKDYILSNEIRRGIWNIALNQNLNQYYPSLFQHFCEKSVAFDSKLDEIESYINPPSKSKNPDHSAEEIFQDWWKGDPKEEKASISDVFLKEFHLIQNATSHRSVFEGIERIWEHALPIVLNKRNAVKLDFRIDGKHSQESFNRFISIQPTCSEDEDLLCRILDLLGFLLNYLSEPRDFLWVVPQIQKGSTIWRLLENCDNELIATSTVARSVFNLYSVLVYDLKWLSEDTFWDLLNILTNTLYKLSLNGFTSSPAVLHAVLYSLANLTAEKCIIEKLSENLEYTQKLYTMLCDALYEISTRTTSLSFRNIGSIYYLAVNMLHLILCMRKSCEWIIKGIQVLPFLWASIDARVRVVGFQICATITSTRNGAAIILSEIQPITLWETCYKNLIDQEQIPLIRQRAGMAFANLILQWEEMEKVVGLELPKSQILEDMLKLLPSIYWHSKLSHNTKILNTKRRSVSNTQQTFITPNLLICISNVIVATLTTATSSSIQNGETILSDICTMLFRLIGYYTTSHKTAVPWRDSCGLLDNLLKAIITLFQTSPKLSSDQTLVSDKNLSALYKVFENETCSEEEELTDTNLWITMFDLLTICNKSTTNMEFERSILLNRNHVFPIVTRSLASKVATCRKAVLRFLKIFLQTCSDGNEEFQKLWKDHSHEENICEKLVHLSNSRSCEERISSLMCSQFLSRVSVPAKAIAISGIGDIIKKVFDFGSEFISVNSIAKKDARLQEIICSLYLLSSLLFESEIARNIALKNDIASALHLVYKYSVNSIDLLTGIIECLINFTDSFPKGSHSLTLTTGLGLPPRKMPTLNSLFVEISCLLHQELENADKNFKIIDRLFLLLKNCVFSNECRNCLVKINILSYIKRLHITDKKWCKPVKLSFLKFVLDLSVHPDMQLFIAKIPEAIDILILLSEYESSFTPFQILRNLCFHSSNRLRFLNDHRFMPFLSERFKHSDNSEELECIGVTLWALAANSEKAKVIAKKTHCGANIELALQKLRNDIDGKRSDQSLITLLENVSHLLNSSADS